MWYLQLAGDTVVKYFTGPQVITPPYLCVVLAYLYSVALNVKCMKRFVSMSADSRMITKGNTSLLYSSTYFGLFSCMVVFNFFYFYTRVSSPILDCSLGR